MRINKETIVAAYDDFVKPNYVYESRYLPPNIQLPDSIHRGIQEAVFKTERNNREYSRSFYYESDVWQPGMLARGYRKRVSIVHGGIVQFMHPELFLHTHPSVKINPLDSIFRLFRHTDSHEINRYHAASKATRKVFSPADIHGSELGKIGSVGNIVASTYGTVLMIKNNPNTMLISSFSGITQALADPMSRDKIKRVEKEYQEYNSELYNLLYNGNPFMNPESVALNALANALRQRYTIYHNCDPYAPTVTKVEPGNTLYDRDLDPITVVPKLTEI